MSEKVIAAGDEIDSYCTSCRLMLAHTVVALIGEKPDKVQCKTCGKQHKYRAKAPKSAGGATTGDAPKKPKAVKTKTGATRTRKAKETEAGWEEALAGRDMANSKMYTIAGEYQEREVINHKTFGFGVVVKLLAEGKMQVRFKEGTKLLAFGKK
ncbi:hypothetical protein U14_00659 [Candidatus Moduliflexus flocculans]|uniref:Uncharacterized protein n=1 Tax=Candidatus Moduliflexus flocculans TaxID=1499966 RepID=A0A0S6VQE9_9BACT|nr:hypothetical protein U14_00659 [Candidatus Moduliflexus flocculans]